MCNVSKDTILKANARTIASSPRTHACVKSQGVGSMTITGSYRGKTVHKVMTVGDIKNNFKAAREIVLR